MNLGSGFGGVDEVNVMVGGIKCEVNRSSATSVTCTVGKVALGEKLPISITVTGKGTAQFLLKKKHLI